MYLLFYSPYTEMVLKSYLHVGFMAFVKVDNIQHVLTNLIFKYTKNIYQTIN